MTLTFLHSNTFELVAFQSFIFARNRNKVIYRKQGYL